MVDVLEPVPENGISHLMEIVSRELPVSLAICEFLKAVSFWRKEDSTYDASLYRYRENVESAIFVGILHSGCQKPGIFVYAATGYESLLRRVLSTTAKIDWRLLPLFHSVIPRLIDTVESVVKEKHFVAELCFDGWILSTDAETVATYKPTLSPEVYSARLGPQHVDSVYECWPSQHLYTKEAIGYAVAHRVCVGIFSRQADRLLAWCVLSPYGAVGALQTQPQARGHGYGRTAIQLLARQLVHHGFVPFTITLSGNEPALATFAAVGFRRATKVRYIRVSPLLGSRSKL